MKKQLVLLALIAVFTGVGCNSKKNEVATPPVETPVVSNPTETGTPSGGGTDGGGITESAGDTVDFVPVDFATFNTYVGTHPLNAPKNIKITANLKGDETYHYSGAVKISYEDNGQTWTGTFESSADKNQDISGLRDNGELESKYNYWFVKDTKTVFSGLFQDQYGAIVFIVDKTLNQGDGQGSTFVSGSVYFRNFAQSQATQSPYRKCWYIYAGPYDCRTDTVIYKSGLYPTTAEGYRKLGTFSGMTRSKAFNL